MGGLRDWLLSDAPTAEKLAALARGITPEMAAAVAKISGLKDLMVMAAKCSVVTRFRDTIGLPGRGGSARRTQTADDWRLLWREAELSPFPSPACGGGTGRGHATRLVHAHPLPNPPPQAGEGAY